MYAIRKLSLAALALAVVVVCQLSAAPIPGVKVGGEDGDKWLLDDAEVVMVFNFKQLYASKLMKGKYTKLFQDALKKNDKVKEQLESIGLDPTKDVDSVIISAGGTSKETAKGRIVVKGNFDVEKLTKKMKESDKIKSSKEGTVEVFEVEQGMQTLYGAFSGKDTFVLTDTKETTVELAKGPTKAAKFNKEMKAALSRFTGKESMAMVVVVNEKLKEMAGANPQVAAAVKSLNTVTASVVVDEGITINAVGNTTDAKAATALEKQLNAVKTFAGLAAGSADNPAAALGGKVLEAIKIDKTRDSVTVTVPITKEMIEEAEKLAPGGGR